MKFARLGDCGGVASADALRQAFGFFSEMLEGRIVRQRTCRHSDLLARSGGLAACGPPHQARKCLPVGVLTKREGLALSADWERPARSQSMLADWLGSRKCRRRSMYCASMLGTTNIVAFVAVADYD